MLIAINEYDRDDDLRRSIEFAYEHIRERVASGGKGWRGFSMKLLDCPFCGGNGFVMEALVGPRLDRQWQASCTECHCGTPVAFDTKELAAAAWNKRK